MKGYSPNKQNGGILGQLVLLALQLKVDLSTDSVVEVDLAIDHV